MARKAGERRVRRAEEIARPAGEPLNQWVGPLEGSAGQLRLLLAEYRRMGRSGAAGDPYTMLSWLAQVKVVMLRLAELAGRADELVAALEEAARVSRLESEADLREALKAKGLRADGQWPQLYIERAIRVEINEAAGRTIVGEEILPTLHLPRVMGAIEDQVRRLLPQKFDPKRFLEMLVRCSDRVGSEKDRSISIWELYRGLLIANQSEAFWRSGRASLFRPFSEQTFRACVTALLERGVVVTPDGRELRLLPPLKPEDGMYLYNPAENRFAFVGRVQFVSRQEQLYER